MAFIRGKRLYVWQSEEGMHLWQSDTPSADTMSASGWASDQPDNADLNAVFLTRKQMDDLAVKWMAQMSPKRRRKAEKRSKR